MLTPAVVERYRVLNHEPENHAIPSKLRGPDRDLDQPPRCVPTIRV